ncbi:hypothetical protein QR685DRAFT_567693 [Neurospora intermedia]|uniref:Uncharacterized protein n=1 Tax=Neurospora intermedia TaxID=5142 RepID=A0ABR3DR01_NEUIN
MRKKDCRDMVPKSCGLALPCHLYFCSGCIGITTIGKSEDIRKTSVCKYMQDESEQSVTIGIVLPLCMGNRRIGLQDLSFPKSCHRKGEHFMVPGQTEDTPCLRQRKTTSCAMRHSRDKKVLLARTVPARAPVNTDYQAPRR